MIAIQAAVGFLVGYFLVAGRFAWRRRHAIEARVIAFECRACGHGPSHSNVGTWGGLIPIEDVFACGGVLRGGAGVFLCAPCYVEVAVEATTFFRELDPPRKTYPPAQPVTPRQTWLGGWL